MAIIPNIVMLAIAYVTSSLSALIAGLVATIAEAPHILVPTAIREPILEGTFNNLQKKLTSKIEITIHAIIKGIPITPTFKISKRPNLIPRQIIPNLRINLRANLIPSEKIEGTVIVFPINSPMIIDSIIGEIGLLFKFNTSLPIKLLKYIPVYAIKKLKKIPGKIRYIEKYIMLSFL
tara:strand:- start:514 stop:1047 length:534 start_codon:yes stop_codon:yes gene_type:complete